jgi:hypothetical protein
MNIVFHRFIKFIKSGLTQTKRLTKTSCYVNQKSKKTEFPKIKSMNSTLQFQKTTVNFLATRCSKFLSQVVLALCLIGFGSFETQAQVATNYNAEHIAIAPTYAALNAASKTILIGGTWDDDAPVQVNFANLGGAGLDFDFNFNGVAQSSAWVSPNGFITFGSAPTTTNYAPIASSEAYTGAVSAFGIDMKIATPAGTIQTNSISHLLTGTDGNYILKIEWRDFKRMATTERNHSVQIWLYEATGLIEVHVANTTGLPAVFSEDASAQIGLRGTTNSDYNLFDSTSGASWSATAFANVTAPSGSNILTVRSRNGSNIPTAAYRLFRFTPVTCTAPSSLALSNLLINSATLSYTAPTTAPANGYQYEIRTTATPGAALGPNDVSGTSATTTINASGLTANTTYYGYVRSDCGGDFSGWIQVGPFTTLCNAVTTPYLQDFEGATVPNLPPCTSRQNIGAGNVWNTTAAPFDSGFFDQYLIYDQSGTEQANTYFYTEGISLTAGTTYRLSYLYGGSSSPSYVSNRLEVRYGLQPNGTFMTNALDNHPNIKGSPTENVVYFTAPSTSVFYFGFRAYSLQAQGKMYLEEIQIIETDCLPPTALTPSSIASTTATVSWTAPTPAPASGYAYYITTTNPIQAATANLTVGQTYTIASVGTTDFTTIGASSNTIGQSFVATAAPVAAAAIVIGQTYTINFPGTTNFTLIGAPTNNVGVQFIATAAGVGTGNAIPALVSGTGTGTVQINLPNNVSPSGTTGAGIPFVNLTGLANNTTYYIWVRGRCGLGENSPWSTYISFTTLNVPAYCVPSSAGTHTYINNFTTTGGITNIANVSGFALPTGYIDYTTGPLVVTQAPGQPIGFTVGVTTAINTGIAIWVDWNNNGTFEAGERMFNTGTYVTGATGTFNVPGGQAADTYRMRILTDYWATSPAPCVINSLFGGQFGEAEDYNIRVVPPPPALTLSAISSSQCANTPSPLITLTAGGPPTYNTYTWSPAIGVSGSDAAGWTFNTTNTTVYTLTAVQTGAPFALNTVKFTYNATPAPTAVVASPTAVSVCQSGPGQLLSATGGIVNNSFALNETFEAGAPGWTRNNLSTGGSVANAGWTDRANGYNYGGVYSSNDASTFIMSNSDAQGSGTTTSTNLVSPVFSLVDYADASLYFYQYYQGYVNGTAQVDISTNGGTTWTTLNTYSTVSQGTRTNFQMVVVNLDSYANAPGFNNLRLRFNYNASWAWHWAIDNVSVRGTRNAQLVWNTAVAPVANGVNVPGLFTDAASTIPYVAGTISPSVYTLPTISRDYTVSTNASGCSSSATVNVTLVNVVAGTISGGGQTACDIASLTNLTLVGHTGDVIRWEYATDVAFTVGVTPIANTTTTLTPVEFGTFSGIRYFRAVVGNVANSCNLRFTPSVSINLPSTTQSGTSPADVWSNGTPDITKKVIITGDYTVSSDISACSIEVLLGATMTVTNDATITVNGGIIVDPMAGPTAVVFESNTSLLQNSTSNTINSGSVRYIRESTPIIQYDYTYWSSPVDFQIIKNFSPNTANVRFYTFDSGPAYAWAAVPSVTTHLMGAGIGYIIRAPSNISATVPAPWSGEFYGRLRNGSYAVPVNVVGGIQNRNLLGNPYPSAIDADLLYTENPTTLTGNFYFWTHNTPSVGGQIYTADDYAQYNASGGVGTSSVSSGLNITTPNGNIAAGQGFFVEGAASGTVTFNNSIRVSGNNDLFYRSQPIEKHRVWLNVLNTQGAFKQTLVGYIEGATDERDSRFDGDYVETGNVVALYSLLNQEKLTIQGRALPFMDTDVVPLGFKTTIEGIFQIQLADFDGLFAQGQAIYLEDKLLNITHDLRTGDYSFTTNVGTFEDRFDLKYLNSTLSVPTFNEDAIIVYQNNQTLFINSGVTEMARVRLMDVRGRLIAEKAAINATEVQFSQLNVSKQVLLVQITTLDGTIVTKRVIY